MKFAQLFLLAGLVLGFQSAFAFECPFQKSSSTTARSDQSVRDLASSLTGASSSKPLPSAPTPTVKR